MNEFQSAYELSRIEYRSKCQRRELEELLIEGKYVIAGEVEIACRFTDAIIAVETMILSVHNTREEAEAAFEDDGIAYIADPSLADPDPEIAYGPFEESPLSRPF